MKILKRVLFDLYFRTLTKYMSSLINREYMIKSMITLMLVMQSVATVKASPKLIEFGMYCSMRTDNIITFIISIEKLTAFKHLITRFTRFNCFLECASSELLMMSSSKVK